MEILNILLYFIVGGSAVTAAVLLAEAGNPFLSALAILFPGTSLVSYYFIGKIVGAEAVAISVKSTIVSAFIVWMPYLITLMYLTPRLGIERALIVGVIVFLVMGAAWTFLNNKYGLIS